MAKPPTHRFVPDHSETTPQSGKRYSCMVFTNHTPYLTRETHPLLQNAENIFMHHRREGIAFGLHDGHPLARDPARLKQYDRQAS